MKPKIANFYGATLTNPWSYGGFYWRNLSLIIGGSWGYAYDFHLPEQQEKRDRTLPTVRANIEGLKKYNPNIIVLSMVNIDWARMTMKDKLPSEWVLGNVDPWGNIKIDSTKQEPLDFNLAYLLNDEPGIFDGVYLDSWHIDNHLIPQLRNLKPDKKIMFNNWSLLRDPINHNLVDGAVAEDEINRIVEGKVGFTEFVVAYLSWCRETRQPTLITIVASGTEDNLKMMRFGLCTALLGNGYYAYDAGFSRGAWWWYPEYDMEFGNPRGAAYTDGVFWMRDYEKAVVVVNGTNTQKVKRFSRPRTDASTGIRAKKFTFEPYDGRIFV